MRNGASVDLLINNAGAYTSRAFADTNAADLDYLIKLNVTAPTLLASAVVGGMVARGHGAMINISSVIALRPEHFNGIYSATKSFILTLSQGPVHPAGNPWPCTFR